MKKLSLTYRVLKKIGLNFSEEEYGNISILDLMSSFLKHYRNAILLKYCMYSVLLSPINYRRSKIKKITTNKTDNKKTNLNKYRPLKMPLTWKTQRRPSMN